VAHLLDLVGRHRAHPGVGERVAERGGVAPLAAGEHLVEGDEAGEGDLAEGGLELVLREVELLGQLGVGGRAVELALQRGEAFSSARALARTERGTQSMDRSSSRMFPLMRAMAYVSNLNPRSRSNFSMASMSPKMP
jgi:hypothetical protein